MSKNIVIEIDDGIVRSVYCPDEGYDIHILDRSTNWADSQTVVEYFEDIEKEKKNLTDCY
jgi:hypothetical protein|tara:strand:+ start:594 stop:773 length:180 start_codon:yes stop_codon:yes gene_type:complete